MPLLRLTERIGTSGADLFFGATGTIAYGLAGADRFEGAAYAENMVFVGGEGGDTYVAGYGAGTVILDTGSTGSDTLIASGLSFANSVAALIDGRHLAAMDTITGSVIYIADWASGNAIETIQLTDATITDAFLRANLVTLPGYLGILTWEQSDLVASGYSGADAREAISFYTARAREIEFGSGTSNQGNDDISGDSGNNTLFGGLGGDTVRGGSGQDIIYGGRSEADAEDGSDLIIGGKGFDTLYGNAGNDTIYGGDALADPNDQDDVIYGGKGNDLIAGNSGNDLIAGGGAVADPGDQSDTIYGGKGADTIYGNGSGDLLFGGGSSFDPEDQADIVWGGLGDDSIYGNGGNDTLIGQDGNDQLHGGAANDSYVFASNNGQDVILSFDGAGALAGDLIVIESNINGSGINSAQQLLSRVTYSDGNAFFDFSSGNGLTILGVATGSLTVDDFLLI